MREEVGKETTKKEMDNKRIFDVTHDTFQRFLRTFKKQNIYRIVKSYNT